MSYKKRGRAGWTGKKEAKSNPSRERNYAKDEIRQELKQIEEGDDFRYRASNKKKNKIVSLKYWIELYEAKAEKAKIRGDVCKYFGYSGWMDGAKQLKEKLAKLENKELENNNEKNKEG